MSDSPRCAGTARDKNNAAKFDDGFEDSCGPKVAAKLRLSMPSFRVFWKFLPKETWGMGRTEVNATLGNSLLESILRRSLHQNEWCNGFKFNSLNYNRKVDEEQCIICQINATQIFHII